MYRLFQPNLHFKPAIWDYGLTDLKKEIRMGILGTIFTGAAANTIMQIADIPSPSTQYVGEGFLNTMSNIGGTGPTGMG